MRFSMDVEQIPSSSLRADPGILENDSIIKRLQPLEDLQYNFENNLPEFEQGAHRELEYAHAKPEECIHRNYEQ